MGLAPVALGGGYPDLFAQATGLNPLEESSVGELVLGSAYDGTTAATEVGADGKGGYGKGVVMKQEG
jgi:hypothetical protein